MNRGNVRRKRRRAQKHKAVHPYTIKIILVLCIVSILGFAAWKIGTIVFQTADGRNTKESSQNFKVGVIEAKPAVAKEEHLSTVEDPEINAKLQEMAGQDERIWDILEHSADYPGEYLLMLSRNPETVDFVLGYQTRKDHPVPETIGEVAKGHIPHLLQWDDRWGHASYGTSTVAVSGCGPTSLAMIIAGLTGDASVTPYAVARYSEEHGFVDEENNTVWALMSQAAANWGLQAFEVYLEQEQVFSELQSGHPIICSMKPGDFTAVGHFMVLVAVEDGKIRVYDPNSMERSVQLWDYATLEPQIQSMWAYMVM